MINDYKSKTELTAQKLFTAMVAALRSYRDIMMVEEQILRRYEDRMQARREETRLLDVTRAISSELHLNDLLEKIVGTTSDLLDAERASLFLYDLETDELWSRAAEGLESKEIRMPASAGLAGTCFTSGEVLHIPDAYVDDRFNPEVDRRTGFRTRNILCMPVRNKQSTKIGVLQVLNKIGGAFGEVDESRLNAFGSQCAIALENAQLFEDVLNARNYNESILKSLSNGVVTLDTELRIIKANLAAERIFGWRDGAPLDTPVGKAFGDDNRWIADSIDKVASKGEIDLILDSDVSLADGSIISVNAATVPLIDINDQSIGFMLIFEDISREKRVKSTMSRYMSRQLVDQIMEAGDTVLGGATQEATVLFSDIRNFTNISEKLGARGTVSMLNTYFTDMVEIVFRHEGILDKYIGDALLAVFGTPFPGEKDADNAVAVANDMLVALNALNRKRGDAGDVPIAIGIGIATGEVVSGNIGSLRRMDYTVIGDTVNLAARLESANKTYGTGILLSESVVGSLTSPTRLREVDLIRVKGKDRAVGVFEAIEHHTDETFPNMAEAIAAFESGLDAYRKRDWRAAIGNFEAALRANPDDGLAALYLDRCRYYQAAPPSDDWDGVWAMETK